MSSFPDMGGTRLVSTLDVGMNISLSNADPREGRMPRWSWDGRELFYRSGVGLIRIPMDPETGRPTGPPEVLFRGGLDEGALYDVARDGRSFVGITPRGSGEAPANEVVVVVNWFEEIGERLANQR